MKQNANASVWLPRAIAAILAALMTLFFAIAINNTMTLGAETDRTKNGPYPVSVAAGRVETLLVQCRTLRRPAAVHAHGQRHQRHRALLRRS